MTKHPQSILAYSADAFSFLKQGMNTVQVSAVEKTLAPHLIIGQREALEKNPKFRQVLPYIILTKWDAAAGATKFIAYRRGKGVGESRLQGNVSIGFGGHIDLVDVVHENSVINLRATITQAAMRELSEEVIFGNLADDTPMYEVGLIIDDSNDVGKVHIGFVMNVQLPPAGTAVCREEELETLQPMTAAELLESGLPLENWTRIALEFFQSVENQV